MEFLFAAVAGLLVGFIPGVWIGLAGRDRRAGHSWLVGIVAIFALAAVTLYTIDGPSQELFARLAILPFSLLVAVAAAVIIVGVPMYASYLFGYRLASHFSKGN